jgi:diacylglycerol kinase (ATP)
LARRLLWTGAVDTQTTSIPAHTAPAGVTGARSTTFVAPNRSTDWNRTGDSSFHPATGAAGDPRHAGAIRSAVIITNERAPHAGEARWRELFGATLGPEVDLTEVRVDHFEGALAAARGAAAWGVDLVIAIGGDGTVNACVNGIGQSRTRLAVVPAGTANDLARMIGAQGDAGRSAVALQTYERRDIDAIEVNGTRFYSAGGVGWVADVAATANRWRAGTPLRRWLLARLGSLIYTLACVFTIAFARKLGARYRVRYRDAGDGREKSMDVDAYGMLVANCDRVGKAFHLAPVSELDDGRFELIVFPRTTRWRLLRAALAAQRGAMFDLPEMRWIQVTRVDIEADAPQQFFGDGETLEAGSRFEVGLAPTPVRLMAPVVAETEPADELELDVAIARMA